MISPTQSGIGGVAQHVQGLSNFLIKKGHKVDIISSENTFTIPIKGLKNPSFMISAFFKTKLKKGNDIVHAHNLPSALSMKNASGKKILTLHGIYSEQIELLHGKTTGKVTSSYEKDALSWADAVTVISKEAYEHYSKLGFKVSHIPNAINIDSLSSQKERKYERQIIFVGRLSKEKGISGLLEIAKSLPNDIHLFIIGSGPEEDKVKETCKQKSNLHLLGYQQHDRTISLIRGSDAIIQPSLVEGVSTTILEAMACKTPIIASKISSNMEILSHGKSAILVEIGDTEKMLNEIISIFNDKPNAMKIAEQAFVEVKKYDWKEVGEKYLTLYDDLLQKI